MSIFNWADEYVSNFDLWVKCEVCFPFHLSRICMTQSQLIEICQMKTPDGRFIEVEYEHEIDRKKDGTIAKVLYITNPSQERFVYEWCQANSDFGKTKEKHINIL